MVNHFFLLCILTRIIPHAAFSWSGVLNPPQETSLPSFSSRTGATATKAASSQRIPGTTCWLSPDENQFQYSPKRDEHQISSSLLWNQKQQDVRTEIQSLSSTEEIQKCLVEKGLHFPQATNFYNDNSNDNDNENDPNQSTWWSPSIKVTGCTANVVMQVGLTKTVTSMHNSSSTVQVRGTCDALVSRGLLAIWSSLCEKEHVETITQQDASQLADDLGLRTALSRGRNDGLASLVRTTQQLIRETLTKSTKRKEEENNLDTPLHVSSSEVRAQLDTRIPNEQRSPTVALLLSGGVDSSVALHLLLKQGYNVTAFYLKIWLQDEVAHLGTCPWEDDVQMCRQVCQHAGDVPLEIISLQQEYHDRVISYTIEQAQQGRTPNPDVMCNSRIKFGCFYECLSQLTVLDDMTGQTRPKFDFVATGHYAQLIRSNDDDLVKLHRAPDPVKDQSYFLCALTQEQLQRVLFPIGHLEKKQVRELAVEEFQLPNCKRPDSQGLCFLGQVKFGDFLKAYLGEEPGDIVDAFTGELLGHHKGLWFHTVGQRKGLGPSLFPKATAKGPWYVVAKDPDRRIVYCSNQYDQVVFEQARKEFTVESVSWVAGRVPEFLHRKELPVRLDFKIRHGPRIVSGTAQRLPVERTGGGSNSDEYQVTLDAKDGGLAPGQYVVFYQPGTLECLGGGVISERHWAKFLLSQEKKEATLDPIENLA